MYLGYRTLFQYRHYYFQLVISADRDGDIDDCIYCKNNESLIHFDLALYGWKENGKEKIQPDNVMNCEIMINNTQWNKKNIT
jgi:hypothetical protein